MKESIGNAFVSGLVIMFLFLIVLILTFAINYSRANKIKNRLLNYIAAYSELHSKVSDGSEISGFIDLENNDLKKQINEELAKVGYRRNEGGFNQNYCPDKDNAALLNPQSDYRYCVYGYKTSRGYYYGVTTFMYFDIPIIGTTLEFPVYGETRIIYDLGSLGGNVDNQVSES